jgi:hypothetical protein
MKKLLLTLTVVTVSALTMYGQGRVSFNNEATFAAPDAITVTNNASFSQGASGGNPGDGIGGDLYSVQLRWASGTFVSQALFEAALPTSSSVYSGSVFLANTGPLATFSGFFDAGVVPIPGAVGTYTMQAWAWYNQGFATYSSAVLGLRNAGQSDLFTVNVTAPPSPVNSTVFPGFQVWTPIPEPSTFALAGLGAASLLLFRRRK